MNINSSKSINLNSFKNKYILSKKNKSNRNNFDDISSLNKIIENINNYSLNDLLKTKINAIEFLEDNIEYQKQIINLLYLIDTKVYILLNALVDYWSNRYLKYLEKDNDDNSRIFKEIIEENYMDLLFCYMLDINTFRKYCDTNTFRKIYKNNKTNKKPYSFLMKIYFNIGGKELLLYKNIQYYLKVLLFIYNCLNDYMIQNNKFINEKKFISKLNELKKKQIIGEFIQGPIEDNFYKYKKGIDYIKTYIIAPVVKNVNEDIEFKDKLITIKNIKKIVSTNTSSQSTSNTEKKSVNLIETNNTVEEIKNISYKLEERVSKLENLLNIEKDENYKMLYFIKNQAKFFNTHLNNYANYQSYIIQLNKSLGNYHTTEYGMKTTLETVKNIMKNLGNNVEDYMKTTVKFNKIKKNDFNRLTLKQSESPFNVRFDMKYR